jgi:hypothetical protein
MKNERKHGIDKLFYESLSGNRIEPSASVWNSLTQHIPSRGAGGLYLLLFSSLIIGAASLLLIAGLRSDRPAAKQTEQQLVWNETVAKSHQYLNPMTTWTADEEQATNAPGLAPTSPDITLPSGEGSSDLTYTQRTPESMISSAPYIAESNSGKTEMDMLRLAVNKVPYMKTKLKGTGHHKLSSDKYRIAGKPRFNLPVKDTYARKASMLFGAGFSPAINIYPDGQNRNDYSFEVTTTWEKAGFIAESGLGLQYASENAQYQINYTSYDSVGFYIGVISFSPAPNNPDSVVLQTSFMNIYDSIDHVVIRENSNKYLYLQIPFRIGYRLHQSDRFSIDLKTGIIFSVQIYRDIPGVPYQGTDAGQVEVNRLYPDRLQTNWQYTAGIGLNYHVSSRLRFTLMPQYRQYIKSVYSPNSSYPARSPYAFGLWGGVYFHF